MVGWFGRSVDRVNAGLVRLRTRHGDVAVDRESIRGALHALPADPFAGERGVDAVVPIRTRAAARVEEWTDSRSDWTATRIRSGSRQPGPAVVVLHGWLAVGLQMTALRALLAPLRRGGTELWLPWLPGHGPRTPAGSVSGAECLSADLRVTAEAIRLGVFETLELTRWLRARGQPVALLGLSLGGWIAALAAAESAEFERVVLYTPVVDPARSFADSPLVRNIRERLEASAVRPELTAELMDRVAPVRRTLRVPPERVLILGARHDNVVDNESLRRAAAKWNCDLEWLEAGHITAQWSPRGRRRAREWLAG